MENDIGNRLLLIVNELEFTQNKLAKHLGYHNTVVRNIIKGRNAPSYEFMQRLKNFDYRIDMNWLITGEGEAFQTDITTSLWKELVESLKRENLLLREKISEINRSNNCKNENKKNQKPHPNSEIEESSRDGIGTQE